ncbi:MAG: formylglycine-generating enzyme family protein [Cyclobacteriaceae bacterium]|nr:formylglycine-generating enzyme family protein [Cyclobacteriaceae bacterium]
MKKACINLLVFLLAAIGTGTLLSFQSDTTENDLMVLVKGGLLKTVDPVTNKNIEVNIKPFLLDKNLVTVAEFEAFVYATHYVTEAENFGNAGVFDDVIHQWSLIDGADFRYPFGRNKPKAEGNHPVTQVSWNDAIAYVQWKGKRLPTQWEWELAAKNGENSDQQYTWGENLIVGGQYKANTWQGSFPYYNTKEDGYAYTSPVGAFGKNKLGLTDMGGNVWQWCEDSIEPTPREAEIDPSTRKVTRGGSFLCDPMVCHGFQVKGRASSTPESSMVHIGFRCAKNP